MSAKHLQNHIQHIHRRNRNKGTIPMLIAIAALEKEFIGIDTPEMIAHRVACEGYMAHVENSPEMYGQSIGQLQAKYHNPLACHDGKNDADCELDETSAAIIGATIHTGDVEKPL